MSNPNDGEDTHPEVAKFRAHASCEFCDNTVPATHMAAQSGDEGRTVSWVPVCEDHVAGWNDGSDWNAPVFQIKSDVAA